MDGTDPNSDEKKTGQNRSDRGAKGRFQRGNRGNPAGRPRGSRNRITRLVEELLSSEAEELTRTLISKAQAGNGTALRLAFERLDPPHKHRTVQMELPVGGLVASHDAVIAAVASGHISPQEGIALSQLVEQRQRAVERADFAARLEALEIRMGKK
jgi:hypothetical protein